jgi:diguanylate cyclase (GGDEF)-like protein
MTSGAAPRSVPDALDHPAYRDQAVVRELGVRCYTGEPINDADGSLFGTICGFDRRVMPAPLLEEIGRLLDVFTALLESMLRVDRERLLAQRREEAAATRAATDALTGLRNRRGWDDAVTLEAERLGRFGDPAVVVVVDIDGLKAINDREGHSAGDAHLRRAAALLSGAVRDGDVLARLGGDEFAWLLFGMAGDEVGSRVTALWDAMLAGGVEASIGWAPVGPGGLERAVALADERMYIAKRRRRSTAPAPHPG